MRPILWRWMMILGSAVLLTAPRTDAGEIEMTVLCDNYVSTPGTIAAWGFSCLIEGTERTILFDSGTNGGLLLKNVEVLKKDLSKVDAVVISHHHWDHSGGLDSVLTANPGIPVYFCRSFPETFSQRVSSAGGTPIPVDSSTALCRGVYTTGEITGAVNEQALMLDTDEGLVVITGCSHPGVLRMLQAAQAAVNKPVYLVFGGFHLMSHSETQVDDIMKGFRALGVEKVGATHCTGDRAMAQFKAEYGADFLSMGVGCSTLYATDTPILGQQ